MMISAVNLTIFYYIFSINTAYGRREIHKPKNIKTSMVLANKDKLKQEFKVRLYKYVLCLVKFLSSLPNDPVIREIKTQLMDSGTSIGANYFEAQGASSKQDYKNFFNHSLKSANETKFWLAVLRDSELVPQDKIKICQWLLDETKEISNIFASSILTMRNKK